MTRPPGHAAGAIERLAILGCILGAVLLFAGGVWLSVATRDGHWLNRAGAAIVVVEGLLVLVEHFRHERLETAQAAFGASVVFEQEKRRALRSVRYVAIAFACLGELLHGFGDLFLAWTGIVPKH